MMWQEVHEKKLSPVRKSVSLPISCFGLLLKLCKDFLRTVDCERGIQRIATVKKAGEIVENLDDGIFWWCSEGSWEKERKHTYRHKDADALGTATNDLWDHLSWE